jgi:hypothetical protein
VSGVIDHQVRGFEIAVDESGVVGDFEAEEDLAQDIDGLLCGAAGLHLQVVINGATFEKFHGDIEGAVGGGPCIKDLDDVWAFESCNGEGFALKTSECAALSHEVWKHDFDGDGAVEGRLSTEEYGTHATASNFFLEDDIADRAADKCGQSAVDFVLWVGFGGEWCV